MWLLRGMGRGHLHKIASINRGKVKSVLNSYTQIVLLHQGIVPDTLLHRFFHFLGTCPKYRKLVVKPDKFEILRERFVAKYGLLTESKENSFEVKLSNQFADKLGNLSCSDLLQFIIFMGKANLMYDSNHYKASLIAVDNVCCKKIPTLPVEEALRMNYCLLSLLGPSVKFLKSYNLLLDNFVGNIKENIKSPVGVLILFFSGIARKHPKAREVVKLSSNYIFNNKQLSHLSTTELILVSEVAFKTGLKILNLTFIEHLVNIVRKDIPKFVKDPELFVVVIKSMRHNKFHNRKFLDSVQKCLIEDKTILRTYNFAQIAHLLALYADALSADLEFMNYIVDRAIVTICDQNAYNPFKEKGKGRSKDMARLLWATSYLGFKINGNVLEKNIMPVILEKVESGVYNRQRSVLIDTVLSLWIMGHKPLELLPHVFTKEMNKYLREINRVRYKARLQLLSTCISIETPEVMNYINIANFDLVEAYNPGEEKLLAEKPFLKRFVEDIRNHTSMSDSINITCNSMLPYLNIPGIIVSARSGQWRNSISIEVLDSSNCLHDTNIPNGLMLLKLRLLRKLGHRIVLVHYNDYESEKSLIMFQIEDEIMNIHGS